jgi:TPR repeat protein
MATESEELKDTLLHAIRSSSIAAEKVEAVLARSGSVGMPEVLFRRAEEPEAEVLLALSAALRVGSVLAFSGVERMRLKAAALRHFGPSADGGDPAALYNLGLAHGLSPTGEGSERAAEACFRRAADAGHIPSAHKMGMLLQARGETTAAEKDLEKAAAAGDREAATRLALSLGNRAVHWLRKAAADRPPATQSTADGLDGLVKIAAHELLGTQGEPDRFLD